MGPVKRKVHKRASGSKRNRKQRTSQPQMKEETRSNRQFALRIIAARIAQLIGKVGRFGKPPHEPTEFRGGDLAKQQEQQLDHETSFPTRTIDESSSVPSSPHDFAIGQKLANDAARRNTDPANLQHSFKAAEADRKLRHQAAVVERCSFKPL